MKNFFFFICVFVSLPAAEQPHIILVMADDQGYGDCGFTGHSYVKTPNLDAMSQNSVIFDRFYAGAPVCSPTRASVMTGRNPVRVNVPNHGHYLRPHETTIAEALKTNGYLTAHFGKWHIGSVQKESPTSPGGQGFDHWLTGLNFFDREPYLSLNGKFQQFRGQGTVITMDHALTHLKSHSSKQPTFTVIWFPSPHLPHRETASNPDLYKGQPHAPYYQEITLIDEQIGRLRRTLRDLKIANNTLLWYTSDNGGLVKESSGGRAKKGSVYEGGLRVPSIIEYPSKFEPTRISAPTSSTDIYPTLLALTKIKVENQTPVDGINLLPFIKGEESKRSKPIGFWHNFTVGQSTRSDLIIKKLMEAQQGAILIHFQNEFLKTSIFFQNTLLTPIKMDTPLFSLGPLKFMPFTARRKPLGSFMIFQKIPWRAKHSTRKKLSNFSECRSSSQLGKNQY
jgi:arylsulfatase A-like enzyme